MKDKLLKNYVNKLSINDINDFAVKNDIVHNKNELNTIYDIIKNDYDELLYGNSDNVFNKLKSNVSSDNYDKIINLFFLYKKKYAQLL